MVTWAATPDSPPNDSTLSSTLSRSRTLLPIPQSSTQPASKAFSPPSIYAESNSEGFNGGFGGSDNPISPTPGWKGWGQRHYDGYLGYDPQLSSQRFDSFVDSESLKDFAADSPIFHTTGVRGLLSSVDLRRIERPGL
ncbi:hypothetical protein DVH24_035993 [Malus domestica]|uniref:Uncharacterized protein n=1 Tax=Malus domestica TaxID=3750 RepID=A0A498JQA0_MALDO|nr:hypothetical protein DVH24_035993 [Malus domestica]